MLDGEPLDANPTSPNEANAEQKTELRDDTRVSVGRAGTLLVETTRDGLHLPCGVVDISVGGCRIMLPKAGLGHSTEWTPNMPGRVRVALQPNRELTLAGNIVWSKAMGTDAEVIAFRFPDLPDSDLKEIRSFISVRVRADAEVPMPSSSQAVVDETFVAVTTKIRFFAQLSPHPHKYPWRYEIQELSGTRLRANYVPNKGEALPPPELDADLSLTYSPPSWEAENKGVIRFTSRVVKSQDNQIELLLNNTSGEVMASIRAVTKIVDVREDIESRQTMIVIAVSIVLLLLFMIYFFS